MSTTSTSRIVIVGAGTFGLSTAFHLLGRGYTDVTVLDRARELPAVDAAGTDINKVIRSCYSDMFYAKLAREAMEAWKQPMWEGCYHECGVINVGGDQFDDRWKENDMKLGAPVERLPDAKAIKSKILSSLRPDTAATLTHSDSDSNERRVGSFTSYRGYFNPEGGWAEAARAVEILLLRVMEMGGRVIENQEVVGLVKDRDERIIGVKCRDGKRFEGDRVILAIGSWTASTFPELKLDSKCLATGQSVAIIQLSTEEKERYKGCHIYLDFQTGLYTFPPTEDGIVKLSMHTAGHTHMMSSWQVGGDINHTPVRKISTPRTITSHPSLGDGLRVPRSALCILRERFRQVYPELAERPWAGTRMCWYTDSPDGNWVIGSFPGDPVLFFATSGSGHGFKFLPNIGRLVVDSLEGTLDPATAARFAVDRDVSGATNGERASKVPQELDIAELCGPEDEEIVWFVVYI
ncbi:FAD dependent oxidoreductase [Boletus edulis BED1]|uniref:FAD dependent oxidoreductase n=1 Tax=Boletus edulis BED1 TaxID=1328754 RepID=A0AAD4BNE7_BOLED|nr:FAD dependent oxidoreductase [Boletus edulis BED1]